MPIPVHFDRTSRPCPLWRRLLALVYDLLIVLAIVMVVGLLCQLATGGNLIRVGTHAVIPLWYRPLQGLVVAAYFISSWLRGGQTVGMRPWHIQLTRADGGTPTLQQAGLRVLIASAPMLVLMLVPVLGLRPALWRCCSYGAAGLPWRCSIRVGAPCTTSSPATELRLLG